MPIVSTRRIRSPRTTIRQKGEELLDFTECQMQGFTPDELAGHARRLYQTFSPAQRTMLEKALMRHSPVGLGEDWRVAQLYEAAQILARRNEKFGFEGIDQRGFREYLGREVNLTDFLNEKKREREEAERAKNAIAFVRSLGSGTGFHIFLLGEAFQDDPIDDMPHS